MVAKAGETFVRSIRRRSLPAFRNRERCRRSPSAASLLVCCSAAAVIRARILDAPQKVMGGLESDIEPTIQSSSSSATTAWSLALALALHTFLPRGFGFAG